MSAMMSSTGDIATGVGVVMDRISKKVRKRL
jgi:hypothetical protein